jgi:hypothetical protein
MWRLVNGVAEIGLHLPHAHLLDRSDDLVPSECCHATSSAGEISLGGVTVIFLEGNLTMRLSCRPAPEIIANIEIVFREKELELST